MISKQLLNAFISCDGHIKSPKSFVGNRGGLCSPKEGERTYYTTSVRMADDIGELILKIGRRPSFRVNSVGGKPKKFKNGEYVINHDCIVISECRSVTATQYHKDYIDYDGMVYDLTLKKNNTLYIRRKGKCFWGSNCRCYAISVLKTDEEMDEDTQKILNGEKPGTESRNTVKDVPDKFRKWIDDNKDRIARSKSLPYFMRDNEKYVPQVRVTDEALKRAQATQKFNDELMKAAKIGKVSPEPHFSFYKQYLNGGSVQVMDGADRKASDYRALQSIGRSFAESGSTVQITKAVHYKDELYKDVFGGLKGTKYERKCPDLIVDGRYYEYEGYTGQWSKRKLKNMLSHGLKQSDRVIINNNKGGNDRLIRKMIQARLHINADIKEIWLYEKGKLRLFYSE